MDASWRQVARETRERRKKQYNPSNICSIINNVHQETLIPYLDLGFTRFSLVLFSSPPMVARSPIVVQFAMGASDCVPVLVASSCVDVDALLFRTFYKRFKERYEKERESEIVIDVVIMAARQEHNRVRAVSSGSIGVNLIVKAPFRRRNCHYGIEIITDSLFLCQAFKKPSPIETGRKTRVLTFANVLRPPQDMGGAGLSFYIRMR